MDALYKVVKVVKDAWRNGKVATVLSMDIKGAFPSVTLDHLYHDPFDIAGSLDQGDPHSSFLYGIYNAVLVEIPRPM
jgi:hypothetical protein